MDPVNFQTQEYNKQEAVCLDTLESPNQPEKGLKRSA